MPVREAQDVDLNLRLGVVASQGSGPYRQTDTSPDAGFTSTLRGRCVGYGHPYAPLWETNRHP